MAGDDKRIRLDPRKARKLTDRACAHILGGWVGAMGTSSLYAPEQIREALEAIVWNESFWLTIRKQSEFSAGFVHGELDMALGLQAEAAAPEVRALYRSLGGLVSGLRVIAHERAVRTALGWWIQQDEQWKRMSNDRAVATKDSQGG